MGNFPESDFQLKIAKKKKRSHYFFLESDQLPENLYLSGCQAKFTHLFRRLITTPSNSLTEDRLRNLCYLAVDIKRQE